MENRVSCLRSPARDRLALDFRVAKHQHDWPYLRNVEMFRGLHFQTRRQFTPFPPSTHAQKTLNIKLERGGANVSREVLK